MTVKEYNKIRSEYEFLKPVPILRTEQHLFLNEMFKDLIKNWSEKQARKYCSFENRLLKKRNEYEKEMLLPYSKRRCYK